jgi:hypothetical protein
MPTKDELYEIYRCELEGNKPIEELKLSTWIMLKAMWYLRNIKENTDKRLSMFARGRKNDKS